jgi:hypothetical protein
MQALLPSFVEECCDDIRHYVGGAPGTQPSLNLLPQIGS